MKQCRVYMGSETEAQILWLTDTQIVEYRRIGYYVTVLS